MTEKVFGSWTFHATSVKIALSSQDSLHRSSFKVLNILRLTVGPEVSLRCPKVTKVALNHLAQLKAPESSKWPCEDRLQHYIIIYLPNTFTETLISINDSILSEYR